MISLKYFETQMETLVGKTLFYSDKETGIGWEIEVLDMCRVHENDSIILMITDEIKVDVSRWELIKGPKAIITKIFNRYEEVLNNG